MRYLFAVLLLFVHLFTGAQDRPAVDEKSLRMTGNFPEFFNSVKNNSRSNCLCRPDEYLVFNFPMSSGKTAPVCISKIVTSDLGHIVYRFGTFDKLELEYPSDSLHSFSKFNYSMYLRGGGKLNAGMDLNNLYFTNGNFTYTLFDDFFSEDESHRQGIIITNNSTGKKTTFNAKGKATGHLGVFRDKNIVGYDPDDEAE